MKTKLISALCIMAVILSLLTACQKPEEPSDTEHGTGHTHSYLETEGTYKCECGADYFADTLEFTINNSGDAYILTGIGKCERANITVPAEYEGKPVIGIGRGAFLYTEWISSNLKCRYIKSFCLPEGMEFIDNYAFSGSSVSEINFPTTLKHASASAFSNTPIADIEIPDNINTDENSAPLSYDENTEKAPDSGHEYVYPVGEGTYICKCGADYFSETLEFMINEDDATCTVVSIGSCEKRDIVIPAEHNGMKVTKIGYLAFALCEAIDTVIIPEGIIEICDEAFCESSIKTVSLPQSLSRIGKYAFCDTFLEAVTVPHADIICVGAFDGSLNLREIILCEGVKKVESAFDGLRNLEKIVLPNSIEISADCSNLLWDPNLYDCLNYPEEFGGKQREFTIYNDVIYIGNETNPYLVAHCVTKYISDIVLHPDTEIILPEICYGLNGGFSKIESVSSVVIPKNVRTVCHKYSLLFECAENVYYEGTADEWETLMGDANTHDAKIYFYSEAAPTAEGNYWHYAAGGEDGKIIVWE